MRPERAIEELIRLRDQSVNDPAVQSDSPEHDRWRASVDAVMANAIPATSNTFQEFRGLSYHIGVWTGAPGEEAEDRRYFASQVRRAAALIDAAIYELGLLVDETTSDGAASTPGSSVVQENGTSIFVVHGHAEGPKYELMRLLDRTSALPPVVLHEQPNRGATVIEKLERHATTAAFAVILLTADDVGGAAGSDMHQARGRQNVVLEMGLFIGLLGRSRVAVLYEQDVELPSDLSGLVYIPLDPNGAWRFELLKEIEATGIEIDRTRIP